MIPCAQLVFLTLLVCGGEIHGETSAKRTEPGGRIVEGTLISRRAVSVASCWRQDTRPPTSKSSLPKMR